jgi:hypothetical protein
MSKEGQILLDTIPRPSEDAVRARFISAFLRGS